ncbi:uncharacterized protein JCM15063_000165 [Sporobolomyces koalae]|uniref:uncharacterized protein n=1 Tax=Sporobolomyces koalae TaxID=500713 RepID=UPI0031798AED
MIAEGTDLSSLLGLAPNSDELASILSRLATSTQNSSTPASSVPLPTIATYPDIVYLSYYSLGISLSFEPTTSAYRPKYKLSSLDQLELDKLYCVGVDVYNHDDEAANAQDDAKEKGVHSNYSRFPQYPILLPDPPTTPANPESRFLRPTTTGKDLVAVYGEPSRKGGGDTKGMGIWTEWTPEGIMVEWKSSGLGAWDKGGDTRWRVLSLFEPGVNKGKDEDEE